MRRGRQGGGTETLLEAVPLEIGVKIVFVPALSYNSKEEGGVSYVCVLSGLVWLPQPDPGSGKSQRMETKNGDTHLTQQCTRRASHTSGDHTCAAAAWRRNLGIVNMCFEGLKDSGDVSMRSMVLPTRLSFGLQKLEMVCWEMGCSCLLVPVNVNIDADVWCMHDVIGPRVPGAERCGWMENPETR